MAQWVTNKRQGAGQQACSTQEESAAQHNTAWNRRSTAEHRRSRSCPPTHSLEGKGVRHVSQVQAPHVEDVLDPGCMRGVGTHPRPAGRGRAGAEAGRDKVERGAGPVVGRAAQALCCAMLRTTPSPSCCQRMNPNLPLQAGAHLNASLPRCAKCWSAAMASMSCFCRA